MSVHHSLAQFRPHLAGRFRNNRRRCRALPLHCHRVEVGPEYLEHRRLTQSPGTLQRDPATQGRQSFPPQSTSVSPWPCTPSSQLARHTHQSPLWKWIGKQYRLCNLDFLGTHSRAPHGPHLVDHRNQRQFPSCSEHGQCNGVAGMSHRDIRDPHRNRRPRYTGSHEAALVAGSATIHIDLRSIEQTIVTIRRIASPERLSFLDDTLPSELNNHQRPSTLDSDRTIRGTLAHSPYPSRPHFAPLITARWRLTSFIATDGRGTILTHLTGLVDLTAGTCATAVHIRLRSVLDAIVTIRWSADHPLTGQCSLTILSILAPLSNITWGFTLATAIHVGLCVLSNAVRTLIVNAHALFRKDRNTVFTAYTFWWFFTGCASPSAIDAALIAILNPVATGWWRWKFTKRPYT